MSRARLQRTDTEIAQAAVEALKWNTMIPAGRLHRDGHERLGRAQRHAGLAIPEGRGGGGRSATCWVSRGVTNNITVKPRVKTIDVRDKIEAAFKRSAEIDARRVNVTAQDGKVILSGNVRSWAERKEAEHAAWAAPGVSEVDDRIAVVP